MKLLACPSRRSAFESCAAVITAALTLVQALGGPLDPTGLHCEYQTDPLGVDVPAPRLGWELQSTRRGARQTAYRILVASDAKRLRKDEGDLWDSGNVNSDTQHQVIYAGQPLTSHQVYYWKVRVWNEDRQASPWSKPAQWRMGFVASEPWQARWITGALSTNALPLFRKSFNVSKPLRSAIVYASGLGHHQLFVDGQPVGNSFLDPAWSVYERTVYYTTHDVTRVLAQGPHTFAVMLGKGFYNTAGDRRVHGVHSRGRLQFILEAHLEYTDGTRERIITDSSWRAAEGPITHSAILAGEDYDARRWPAGWDRPGFDDRAWSGALLAEAPAGRLRSMESPPMIGQQVFQPVRIDEPEPGIFVYDFGQNASAVPQLHVRGKAAQTLRLVPAEQRHGMSPRRNDGRGLVNQAGVGSPNYFQYTLAGKGLESWTPQFSYAGFQYLQVEGAVPPGRPNPNHLPVLEKLVSLHVRSAAPDVGSFECSNPLFNRIDRLIDWAVRANLAHVLTDCPHREKLGWLEVSYLMGPSIAGRYDLARLYSKVSRDCADSQAADGRVPTVAPAYPAFSGGFAYTPEWGAAGVVVPWLVHTWYGDRRVLEEHFDTMRRFVDYMERTSTQLVPQPGLGDWYDYGHGKPVGASQFTPVELSAMATFHRCARIVSDTAGILGRISERSHYAQLAERIRVAFNERFFDGRSEYRHHGSPQTANSMALVCRLVPPEREPAVLDQILEDLRQRGYQQTSGDIGHWYLLQALGQAGRHAEIFQIASRTNLGSYGYIVRNLWTSMPEAWDADTGASMNHCMLGHIQEWFLGSVAGIQPDPAHPGFEQFHIAPQPVGDLTWARGSYRSIRGLVSSEWEKTSRGFELRVTIPANTLATVWLPGPAGSLFRANGQPLERVQTVRWLRQEPGSAVLAVGSGRYRFESQPPPAATTRTP